MSLETETPSVTFANIRLAQLSHLLDRSLDKPIIGLERRSVKVNYGGFHTVLDKDVQIEAKADEVERVRGLAILVMIEDLKKLGLDSEIREIFDGKTK